MKKNRFIIVVVFLNLALFSCTHDDEVLEERLSDDTYTDLSVEKCCGEEEDIIPPPPPED